MKVRTIIGNLPILGRYIYPLKNNYSIFKDNRQLYSKGFLKAVSTFPNPKVVVFGLPKSGNVWLQNLLAECLEMDKIDVFKHRNKSGVGMTHRSYTKVMAYRKDFARGVYLMRDMRDIVVSYYHYSKTEEYHRKNTDPFCHYNDIESFYFDYFLHVLIDRYDWLNHAQDYINHGIPLIKYENLWDNPVDELIRLFKSAGLTVDKEIIIEVVDSNDIKKLSKTGKDTYIHIPKSHFRKGGYGNYKNELTDKILYDINTRFREYLMQWGYDLDEKVNTLQH